MTNLPDPTEWLRGERKPVAVYFADADCVEYVADDVTCVYNRVDQFLTLIEDETRSVAVGFKLKGFRNCFLKHREEFGLSENDFIELVKVLECVCAELGERQFGEDLGRRLAYREARRLAEGVKLYDLPIAA
jgi:hypothetical protein